MRKKTYIYVWLDGEPVGFVGNASEGFTPFGALYWDEKDLKGIQHRIRCDSFNSQKTGTIEGARARLKEFLSIAGVYEVVPIVAGRRPRVPNATSGKWTRENVAAVVCSVLLDHGADVGDLEGDFPTGMVHPTARRGLTLRLDMNWLPILPSTTEGEIRHAVRVWCSKVKEAWATGIPYATKQLARTYESWKRSQGEAMKGG